MHYNTNNKRLFTIFVSGPMRDDRRSIYKKKEGEGSSLTGRTKSANEPCKGDKKVIRCEIREGHSPQWEEIRQNKCLTNAVTSSFSATFWYWNDSVRLVERATNQSTVRARGVTSAIVIWEALESPPPLPGAAFAAAAIT